MEIVKSKRPKEYLNWNDIKKMKYLWNVARESMKLYPLVQGAFSEALVDFNYAGLLFRKDGRYLYVIINVNTSKLL